MKKLIALILILVVTSFVVVTNDTSKLENFVQAKVSSNPKNRNWEYVKDRLFDGETEKVFKREGPILILLGGASKQDSLIVNEIIQELRTIIPNKTIDYFNNFTGITFETAVKNNFESNIKGIFLKYKGIPYHDLQKSVIELNFNENPEFQASIMSQQYVNYRLPNEIGSIKRAVFGPLSQFNTMPVSILFDINKEITCKERKTYIQYELLRSLCYIPDSQIIDKFKTGNTNSIFKSAQHIPENSKFTAEDKFLLQKLYSDDFIEQFKNYMYGNYSWKYASSFINKKGYEFKVFSLIIGLGIVVLVLMLSYFKNIKYKYSYLGYLFPVFLIVLHYLNLVYIHLYLIRFNTNWIDFSLILYQSVFVFVVSVLISILLWGLEKVILKGDKNFSYQLIFKVIFTFISFIFPIVLIVLIDPRILGMFQDPFGLFVLGLAIGRGLLLYLNHFSESLVREKEVELSRLTEAKAEAEVKMLQSQINPHFLYNALNSIASLAHTDADKTEKMALALSDLFRHSINRKDKKVNTVEDELSLVQNYLEIEQIRFGDRLEFTIDVEPDLAAVKIPMFVLQPLVENAIKHGVSRIEGQGKIVLKASKKDNGILISIQDNGPDFPEGLISGHGLQTVYDLLRFSYGDKAEISWHNQPQKEIIIYIAEI